MINELKKIIQRVDNATDNDLFSRFTLFASFVLFIIILFGNTDNWLVSMLLGTCVLIVLIFWLSMMSYAIYRWIKNALNDDQEPQSLEEFVNQTTGYYPDIITDNQESSDNSREKSEIESELIKTEKEQENELNLFDPQVMSQR